MRVEDAPDLSGRFAAEFFSRPTLAVCRGLLGAFLVHESPDGITAGRIVEVEGYCGPHDRASHSYGNRQTERTRAMFGVKGHAYIYLIYGMYWCFNVVSGPVGKPQAVLVRALEPVAGIDLMRRRVAAPEGPEHSLCRGPGKLCRSMGIDGGLYGEDLRGGRLYLVPARRARGEKVVQSSRVNIGYAGHYVHKPWRYFIGANPCVSARARGSG